MGKEKMNTITVENCEYEFQDIPGKGKCLVPKKPSYICPPITCGKTYKLNPTCTGVLIGFNLFSGQLGNNEMLYTMLQGINSCLNWTDWTLLTLTELKKKFEEKKVSLIV